MKVLSTVSKCRWLYNFSGCFTTVTRCQMRLVTHK